METLSDVVVILRHEGRQDLAALLADAYVDLIFQDLGSPFSGEGEFYFTHAAISAPIWAWKSLRVLPKADNEVILDALREAWPFNEAGGTVIQSVSFNVDRDSLKENIELLYTQPIGWQRVDRTLDRVRQLLMTASTEEQYLEVGVICRDVLISMAQTVFHPEQHPPIPNDNTNVSKTDVKRMMARYVASEYPGASSQVARRCVNATVDLANTVTHKRTATYRDAAFCAQATVNVIGLISILSGKRDQEELKKPVGSDGRES